MSYYIARNGAKEGPFTLEELRFQNITPETYIWYQGLDNWVLASQVPQVMDVLQGVTPAANPTPVYTAPQPQAQYQATTTYASQAPVSTTPPAVPLGKAIAAVVLFFPTGIPALIRAIKAKVAVGKGDYATAEELIPGCNKLCTWSFILFGIILTLDIISVL